MKFRYPEKVLQSQSSLIREVAQRGKTIPGFLSFAMGNPARESIPVGLIEECVTEVFK